PEVIDSTIKRSSKLFNDTISNTITKNSPKNPEADITLPVGFPADIDEGLIVAGAVVWPKLSNSVRVAAGRTLDPVICRSGWSSKELLEEFISGGYVPVLDGRGLSTTFKLTRTGAIYVYKTRQNPSHVLSVVQSVGTVQESASTLESMGLSFGY